MEWSPPPPPPPPYGFEYDALIRIKEPMKQYKTDIR